MEKQMYTPAEVLENNINGGVTKSKLTIAKMIMLGIFAGAFIAFGGAASSVAAHGVSDVGLTRLVTGAVFPVGLMMVVLTGSELFTGNNLMIMAFFDKKISAGAMLRNLIIVYFSNLIGAVLISVLVFYSGQFDYSQGGLGAYTIKVALAKAAITPGRAVVSGILCNILVCLAILMSGAAKDVCGKILAIFFPISAFVICGFEHCVANMFYLPAGMLAAADPDYVSKAEELYGITKEQCGQLLSFMPVRNLICVTVGNMIGGMLFVGTVFYFAHRKNKENLNAL